MSQSPTTIDRTLPMPTPEVIERLATIMLAGRRAWSEAKMSLFDTLYDRLEEALSEPSVQEWLAEIDAYRQEDKLACQK